MKRYLLFGGITMAVCALACAQEGRVSVPVKSGTHGTVEATVVHCSIVVNTGGSEVVAEIGGPRQRTSRIDTRTPPGMHRIDIPSDSQIHLEQNGDVIHISVSPRMPGNVLTLTVPVDTTLKLNSLHGGITVEGVRGEIDADSTHGSITLDNVSGTVVANSVHGSLKVSMSYVDPSKPLAFTTMMGNIDLALPGDVKANLKLRALHGSIWSDFDMKTRTGNGGTINGGGVDINLYTVNGKITIRKK